MATPQDLMYSTYHVCINYKVEESANIISIGTERSSECLTCMFLYVYVCVCMCICVCVCNGHAEIGRERE